MITASDRIDTCAEKLACGGGRDAGAARGIFSIGDDERDAMLLAQLRHKLRDGLPPRRTDHVSDEKDFHGRDLNSAAEEWELSFTLHLVQLLDAALASADLADARED